MPYRGTIVRFVLLESNIAKKCLKLLEFSLSPDLSPIYGREELIRFQGYKPAICAEVSPCFSYF
jgi:hypothetical protein